MKIVAPRLTIIPRKPAMTPSPTGYAVSHVISRNSGMLLLIRAFPIITVA
jgi:hypothetical protein